jgi:hypothetical protein
MHYFLAREMFVWFHSNFVDGLLLRQKIQSICQHCHQDDHNYSAIRGQPTVF